MIRKCSTEDVDFLYDLALLRYGDRIKDRAALRIWLARAIQLPDIFIARSGHGALAGALQTFFYDPQPELRLLYLVSQRPSPWDSLKLLRSLIEWGKSKGCARLRLTNETGIDLEPFARRLGRVRAVPCFVVDI